MSRGLFERKSDVTQVREATMPRGIIICERECGAKKHKRKSHRQGEESLYSNAGQREPGMGRKEYDSRVTGTLNWRYSADFN